MCNALVVADEVVDAKKDGAIEGVKSATETNERSSIVQDAVVKDEGAFLREDSRLKLLSSYVTFCFGMKSHSKIPNRELVGRRMTRVSL